MATSQLKRAPAAAARGAIPDTAAPDSAEQIAIVATDLFIRNGYHGVSYLGIGKQLGMTHSNVHYYYRTKAALAEAVLRRVSRDTLAGTSAIWTDGQTTLAAKFVLMRDWTYASYLRLNPDGEGGRPWGLLSRFSMEADALSADMRQTIRATLRRLEDNIRSAVKMAVAAGELSSNTPVEGVTLQIASVMYLSGQLTRHTAGFSRLDELLHWTLAGLLKAYGSTRRAELLWPACPEPARLRAVQSAA